MGNRNKNKSTLRNKQIVSGSTSDYDLLKNLKRLESYSPHQSHKTVNINIQTCNFNPKDDTNSIVSNSKTNGEDTQTESGFPALSYSKLDDKITNLTTENENAHTALRKELEGKISTNIESVKNEISSLTQKVEKKLSTAWFLRSVGVLGFIAAFFAGFSYNPLLDDNNTNKDKISKIETKQAEHQKDIEAIYRIIDDLNNKLNGKADKRR